MKVLLTHGYFIQEDEKEQVIMKPYPPLGILYLSAFLNKNKVYNTVFDSTFSSFNALQNFITAEKPNVVAIYTNLMTKLNIVKLVKWLQNLPCKIVLGGPDVTYNTHEYLQLGAHALVIGEGEESLLELVTFYSQNNNSLPNNIPGIAYLNNQNQVVKNPPRTKIKDIDTLPFPNRAAINLNLYLDAWKAKHGENSITVSTQRGCPYTCKWCSTAVYGQSYRRRSPQNVVQELKEIYQNYNPNAIWFVDDVFTVSHKWLNEFAQTLQQNQLTIKFECITRADRLNIEVLQTLKKAGCFRVWIGAESGSQKIIDAMDRRVDVQQVREMIQEAQKLGIQAGTFIMLGYPGETITDIDETINHLKTSNPEYFTITVAYPIKGTRLFHEVEATQTKAINWQQNTDRDRDFTRTYNRKFYDYAVKHVVNEVNYNKLKILGKAKTFTAIKLKVKSKAARYGMLFQKLSG